MRLKASIPLAIALLLCTATVAAAQLTPGYTSDRDRVRAEYRGKVLAAFQEVLGSWVRAVNDEDVEAAADLYAEDAFVHLGRTASDDGVRGLIEQWLPRVPQVRVGLSDFDVSGDVAYGSVRVQFLGSGTAADTDGIMAVVMRRQGRDWRIRSQVMVTDPSQAVAGTPSASDGPGLQ